MKKGSAKQVSNKENVPEHEQGGAENKIKRRSKRLELKNMDINNVVEEDHPNKSMTRTQEKKPLKDNDSIVLNENNVNDISVKLKNSKIGELKALQQEEIPNDDIGNDNIRTPISNFKLREGSLCRKSGSILSPTKRKSLTPNHHNFLHKCADPVAQRMDSPCKKTVVAASPIKNVSKSSSYFHDIVEKEEKRFKGCCDKWNKYLEENCVPEKSHGNVLSAIGQALLLRNKRFKQFKELIDLHNDQSAERTAYASDLDGFWEMIYIQVEDIHKRFEELELLKSNNWEETEVKPVFKAVVKKKPAPSILKTKKDLFQVKKNTSNFKKFRQQMMAKTQADSKCESVSLI